MHGGQLFGRRKVNLPALLEQDRDVRPWAGRQAEKQGENKKKSVVNERDEGGNPLFFPQTRDKHRQTPTTT